MRASFTVLLALGLSLIAFGQQGGASPSSVNPISDYVAFRLFFAAVAENSSPTAGEAARQDARLDPIRLNAIDKDALVKTLAGFKADLTSALNTPQTASLNVVIQSTLAGLIPKMSPDGFQRLYTYVRFQKKYMREAAFPASMTTNVTTTHH